MLGVAALALVLACGGAGPTQVEEDGRGVLFIGNSLTYANDLPEMVQALALASGVTLRVGMVANPDWSLENHWNGGGARSAIRRGWDVVVLQQGPLLAPRQPRAADRLHAAFRGRDPRGGRHTRALRRLAVALPLR
ncbi:MAG TPA: hypothetical protein VFJ16_10660 [Longimicrobium sp.]|nr:hypothetical protein [Longimicrobium sp.]